MFISKKFRDHLGMGFVYSRMVARVPLRAYFFRRTAFSGDGLL